MPLANCIINRVRVKAALIELRAPSCPDSRDKRNTTGYSILRAAASTLNNKIEMVQTGQAVFVFPKRLYRAFLIEA